MVHIKQDLQWIQQEAKNCLYCLDAPCIKGCPAQVNIPQFIRHLRYGNIASAGKEIMDANPLGTICGQLCPSERLCEKNCVLNEKIGKAIRIRDLQKFACENSNYQCENVANIDKKIAVIGAGPAGLACSAQLVRYGYQVDLYEKSQQIAGVVNKEIPNHRINHQIIQKDFQAMDNGKINFINHKTIDLGNLKELSEKYDAVFIGVGLDKDRNLNFAENKENVYYCSEYLEKSKRGALAKEEGTVLIIGGGDSALDAATTASLQGASKVVLAYRRSMEEMPATSEEFLTAVNAGIDLMYLVSPVDIKQEKGKLSVTFVKNKLVKKEGESKKNFEPIIGSDFILEVDQVVIAIGKSTDLQLDSDQYTNIFIGGDYVRGGGTIVEAVADGKNGAKKIHQLLSN